MKVRILPPQPNMHLDGFSMEEGDMRSLEDLYTDDPERALANLERYVNERRWTGNPIALMHAVVNSAAQKCLSQPESSMLESAAQWKDDFIPLREGAWQKFIERNIRQAHELMIQNDPVFCGETMMIIARAIEAIFSASRKDDYPIGVSSYVQKFCPRALRRYLACFVQMESRVNELILLETLPIDTHFPPPPEFLFGQRLTVFYHVRELDVFKESGVPDDISQAVAEVPKIEKRITSLLPALGLQQAALLLSRLEQGLEKKSFGLAADINILIRTGLDRDRTLFGRAAELASRHRKLFPAWV